VAITEALKPFMGISLPPPSSNRETETNIFEMKAMRISHVVQVLLTIYSNGPCEA